MSKYFKYLWYVVRHKWFVFVECCKLGVPWRGLTHDLSKLRPDEFIPYARYFYGEYPSNKDLSGDIKLHVTTKEQIKADFNLAWLRHIHRNPHHWQYWLLHDEGPDFGKPVVLEMKQGPFLEMIADWRGAGKAITGESNPLGWYEKNRDKMILGEWTRKFADEYVGYAPYYFGKTEQR